MEPSAGPRRLAEDVRREEFDCSTDHDRDRGKSRRVGRARHDDCTRSDAPVMKSGERMKAI